MNENIELQKQLPVGRIITLVGNCQIGHELYDYGSIIGRLKGQPLQNTNEGRDSCKHDIVNDIDFELSQLPPNWL